MRRLLLGVPFWTSWLIGALAAQPIDGFAAPPLRLERIVPAGQQSRIWFAWGITPECQTLRGYSATVVVAPRNGTATLARVPEVITPAWIRRGHAFPMQLRFARMCLGAEVLTIGLLYRPRPGFTGRDELVVVTRNTQGMPGRRYEFDITVE